MVIALVVTVVFWMTGVGRFLTPPPAQAQAAVPVAAELTAGAPAPTPGASSPSASIRPPGAQAMTVTEQGHAVVPAAADSHDAHETLPKVLLVLLLMLVLAKIGGDLFARIGQPAVLGELIFGIILGNLGLLHLGGLEIRMNELLRDRSTLEFIMLLSEIGVILLLFEVGLESTIHEMLSVGVSSLAVALVGVICPLALGYGIGVWFLPDHASTVHLFLGAVLAATSVGITARVLRDIGKTHLRESKIILGAAVIDDILGLVVLAVAQGVAAAAITGETLTVEAVLVIIGKAVGFFLAAIILGHFFSRRLYRLATYLHVQGVLLSVSLGWVFLIAYLGTLVGVAPIVGAFAAGLALEETTFEVWRGREARLEDLLGPITTFLVPVFFVYTGMNVDLSTFAQVEILGFAAALTIAAIIGKQACSLVVFEKGLNRTAIGIGMIPRGEVGLIVANIGRTMQTPEGEPLISDNTFSAVVIMVVVTTMMTPPVLKWVLERGEKKTAGAAGA